MTAPLRPPPGTAYAPPPADERPPRKLRTAVLLTVLFGPLGLFYVSVWGGVLMSAIALVSGIFTVGLSLGPCWIVCVLWAVVATADFGADPDTGVPFDAADPASDTDASAPDPTS